MAVSQQITDEIVQQSIVNAMQNVCRTLLRKDAVLVERIPALDYDTNPLPFQLTGNVGFAGDINGVVYLCMSEDFALFAVSTILGMSVSEVEFHGPEVVKDAIGEVTNMTVGGFKNSLCDLGFPCKLTLPTIVRGHKLTVSALRGTVRHVFRFTCAGHTLVADIQMKQE